MGKPPPDQPTPIQRVLLSYLESTGRNPRELSLAMSNGRKDSTIRNILDGKSLNPRLDTLQAIVRETGIPITVLAADESGLPAAIGEFVSDPEERALLAGWRRMDDAPRAAFRSLMRSADGGEWQNDPAA